jgi:hypothetical protein
MLSLPRGYYQVCTITHNRYVPPLLSLMTLIGVRPRFASSTIYIHPFHCIQILFTFVFLSISHSTHCLAKPYALNLLTPKRRYQVCIGLILTSHVLPLL